VTAHDHADLRLPGVEVASAALVLHEVAGLGQRRRAYADEVTTRRLRTM